MNGDNVKLFVRRAPVQVAPKLVRVVDITSPFFSWEGIVSNVLAAGEEPKQYVQISCSLNGFQFPVLTFSTEQLMEVK